VSFEQAGFHCVFGQGRSVAIVVGNGDVGLP
jgi:hypothetical protein